MPKLFHISPKLSVPWPVCEVCQTTIHLSEIREFQREAGSRHSFPRCHSNCAWLENQKQQTK